MKRFAAAAADFLAENRLESLTLDVECAIIHQMRHNLACGANGSAKDFESQGSWFKSRQANLKSLYMLHWSNGGPMAKIPDLQSGDGSSILPVGFFWKGA